MMVGSNPQNVKPKTAKKSGDILVRISGLNRPADNPFATALDNISLNVKAGEIIGIAGIAGNGQSELMEVLSGEWRSTETFDVLMFLGPILEIIAHIKDVN